MKLMQTVSIVAVTAIAVFGLTLLAPRWRDSSLAAAQEMSGATPRGLTVIAMGEARGQPDEASLQLGVASERATAAEALGQANASLQAVLAKLDELGISRSDVQTSAVNVMPIHNPPGQPPSPQAQPPADTREQITAYRATNALTVRVADVSQVGAVIDAATAAGANQVLGVHFRIGDPSSLRVDALQDAVQDARTKAQAIASPLGLYVGEVVDVREVNQAGGPQPAGAYRSAAASTPIEPGQLEVQAQIEVTFELTPTTS